MPRGVNIKAMAQLVDCQDIFDPVWFSYMFGGGFGSRLTKYNKKNAAQGIYTPGISNNISISQVYKKLQNHDFDEIAGFYVALLCFFGEKIYPKINFVEKIPKNSINYVVSQLKCPKKFQNEIYQICHTDYNFIDFIQAAYKLQRMNFNHKSAISVYKLQGNKAIFSILCQIYYNNKAISKKNICLANNTPIILDIPISNYLSGCTFPVVVCPSVNNIEWCENQNGWFLYGYYNNNRYVLDAAGQGRINLSNYALTNRLNYLGNGGQTIPYLICWNWGEVVNAYHYFHSTLLIRDLKNDLFNNYWFNFGLDSLINVRFKNEHINTKQDYQLKPNFDISAISTNKSQNTYLLLNLNGDFIDYCKKDDVFYSDSEVFDWFLLGSMLK